MISASRHGKLPRREALANFNKDHAFRLWGAKHGGVYVPVTKDTPPNPNLSHIPDRDVIFPSGKKFTLMNPAYMLRQIMKDYDALYGIRGHITSLKPLNPEDKPDEWERKALQEFERGVTEVTAITTIDNKTYLRLIRPMVVKKECLKCHASQGYRENDIRGGVGIALPMAPLLASERRVINVILFTHGLIWLLGTGGIGFIVYRSKVVVKEQRKAEDAIQHEKDKVTNILDSMEDGIYIVNAVYDIEYVNPAIARSSAGQKAENATHTFTDEPRNAPGAKMTWSFRDRPCIGNGIHPGIRRPMTSLIRR